MMNRNIINILWALLILQMTACSADEEQKSGIANGKDRIIRFTASVSAPVYSKEGFTRAWADEYNDRLPINATVFVYLYAYNDAESTALNVATDQFGNSITGFTYATQSEVDVASGRSPLAQTYPTVSDISSNDPEDALPKFPASLSNDGYVEAVAIFLPEYANANMSGETLTFTAPADQTTQANVIKADLLTNEVSSTSKTSTAAINLDMRHRMCKVLVQFTPTEGLTLENMPNFTYLVENVKTELSVSLPSGTVTTTGSTGNVNAMVGEPFFIAPQTIAAGTELLKFNLRNIGGTETGIKNVTLKPTTNLEFREGVYYVLNVSVGVRYINLTTTIKDWTGETIIFDKKLL